MTTKSPLTSRQDSYASYLSNNNSNSSNNNSNSSNNNSNSSNNN